MRHLSFGRDTILVLVVIAASVLLLVAPLGYESPYAQNVERERGKVLSVDNSHIQQFGIVKAGEQSVEVEILGGVHRGEIVVAGNSLLGKMETDKMFQQGDKVLMVINGTDGEMITSATVYDHWRLPYELFLLILFTLLLIGFAGWSGLRAVLSFAFAILVMWRILLPGILMGQDPVLLALVTVTLMAASTLFLVAGVGRTALVALIGALLGILLTSGLALALFGPFHLHGAVLPFSETLLYSGHENLNLTRLFIAAVFVGASGAVVDVAIDVATAMNEVVAKRPDLGRLELIRSGFAVGRNMTSTMVTTLLMAYASSYMALLMVFMGQGISPVLLLNTNYVTAEVFKTIVGSFGLVTVAPFTALVGGLVYAGRKHHVTVPVAEDFVRSGSSES